MVSPVFLKLFNFFFIRDRNSFLCGLRRYHISVFFPGNAYISDTESLSLLSIFLLHVSRTVNIWVLRWLELFRKYIRTILGFHSKVEHCIALKKQLFVCRHLLKNILFIFIWKFLFWMFWIMQKMFFSL